MQKPWCFLSSGRGQRIFRATHFLVNNFARDQGARAACPPVCGSRPSRPDSAHGTPRYPTQVSSFIPQPSFPPLPPSGLPGAVYVRRADSGSSLVAAGDLSSLRFGSSLSPLFPHSPPLRSQVSAFSPLRHPPRFPFHFELTFHPFDLFVHKTTEAPSPYPSVQPQVSGLSLHPSFHAPR